MNNQKTSYLSLAPQRKSEQQGIVLLEALVAILLFSMGVLALVGLQAAMIKNTTDSKLRSEASNIAQRRIGYMWSDPDPANLPAQFIPDNTDPRYDISALLPNGTLTAIQPPCAAPLDTLNCPIVITVTWQQPGQAQHRFITTASISGG